jgi:hypothetical protein
MPSSEGHVHSSGIPTEVITYLGQDLLIEVSSVEPIGLTTIKANGFVGSGVDLPNSTFASPTWTAVPGTSPVLEVLQQGYFGAGEVLIRLAEAADGEVVLKDPPLVAGSYVGNEVTPPPGAPNTVGWLFTTPIPHSGGDTNPDFLVVNAIDEFGNTVETFVLNGNGEPRSRPSRRNRIGNRAFESPEAVGYSTGQYVQWSSNPTNASNREPYLGGFGSAHATKPGWVEATRVMSALLGTSIGGTVNAALAPYDSLSSFIFRGLKTTAGSPTVGTWAVNDVILDSGGVLYRCTVAGTPGTWVGVGAPGTYVNMTPGVNMSLDANYPAASRLDRGGDNVRLQGTLVAGAAIGSGAVIANLTTAHRPSSALRPKTFIVRTTGGGARGRVVSNGDFTLNAALALNDNVWLDAITFDQL